MSYTNKAILDHTSHTLCTPVTPQAQQWWNDPVYSSMTLFAASTLQCTVNRDILQNPIFLSMVTLTFDLNFQISLSEGPSTSSVWIWCKSIQRFPRYFIHKQVTESAKNRTLCSLRTACDNKQARLNVDKQAERKIVKWCKLFWSSCGSKWEPVELLYYLILLTSAVHHTVIIVIIIKTVLIVQIRDASSHYRDQFIADSQTSSVAQTVLRNPWHEHALHIDTHSDMLVYSTAPQHVTGHTMGCQPRNRDVVHLWPPYVIGQAIYIFILWFLLVSSFFSSSNLSRRRLNVYHTSTHNVALVRI